MYIIFYIVKHINIVSTLFIVFKVYINLFFLFLFHYALSNPFITCCFIKALSLLLDSLSPKPSTITWLSNQSCLGFVFLTAFLFFVFMFILFVMSAHVPF